MITILFIFGSFALLSTIAVLEEKGVIKVDKDKD